MVPNIGSSPAWRNCQRSRFHATHICSAEGGCDFCSCRYRPDSAHRWNARDLPLVLAAATPALGVLDEGPIMIELKKGAGLVVAGDVRNAFSAVDDALLNSARMCVSVIEATHGTNIPAQQTQLLFRSLTASMTAVVDGRNEIVTALKQMIAIKGQSNLAPVDYGCPDGWGTAMAPDSEVPTRAQISA